ncbi:MAG: hypothetical protein IJ535_03670 [Pseudobutyrivibrio sp.]|uniref:hypothetical protein n=1 Tax=Pseudobutyrivibrio sp. TaxID=2014367 RepID=UPI0025F79D3D|nr:hypothetical protein [Pseudobutyrivibrio sp.]MBQ8488862.1 hypothetical protein [Pseudobutyrivibrio sp.]
MEKILLAQSEIIGRLCALCEELTKELAQFKCIEREEILLKEIMEEDNVYENINS